MKWKDEITERLLDSALDGIEQFIQDETGWFVLLTYISLICVLGTITSLFNVIKEHAILLQRIFRK